MQPKCKGNQHAYELRLPLFADATNRRTCVLQSLTWLHDRKSALCPTVRNGWMTSTLNGGALCNERWRRRGRICALSIRKVTWINIRFLFPL